ncbi:LSU m3Psi1915 methyltransferase RlmH [Helicobacter heilmannii]|uniref:Ribosomal RNA large subunit methyltransferase H n=1 Tax=Helicobacter heilmannii TaxID=35817 RepID=A0A0K2XV65_HELHE|nr:23S rRNA (pseudouridine(1915)-N(3))-methyltransferase RlmH [Helicobacter heilmannii]BDQ27736.1 ribosomal RNA large subunit methyltransferase H [Helicobacter heilmannii]CCM10894.1 LSU m3Psi1915 methyltransferase RlmH [Helicobacter heilmannii ASB1.4]CRF49404.1 LSU m3Psi1915 methyltransferase RlmH [Helicobacter heilmannii]CRI33716.1 LSU m3Psi1915 methyltransferase RlmH [Helicobacter heilmannii]
MTCSIYAISKKTPEFASLLAQQQRACQQFRATLEIIDIAPKASNNSTEAQSFYTKALSPYIKPSTPGYALHPAGKLIDSQEFSQILNAHAHVQFFIAGAYGFAKEFLKQCIPLSLSPLTFSHALAKLILCEQIFRGLSLLNNHPYHK